MNLGTAQVIRADSRHLPLADNSVDLVVTSPPYFALRSYQDGGEHYGGQIGSEPTPAEFVAALLEVTRECVRVLKPSGSLWVNLGDKYAGSRMDGSNDNGSHGTMVTKHRAIPEGQRQATLASAGAVRLKSLIGIPWRYALACIDDLGLILRAEVIWSKPNGLPESVTDRVRRSHEQWFHFTLEPRYFSAVDEIREPSGPSSSRTSVPPNKGLVHGAGVNGQQLTAGGLAAARTGAGHVPNQHNPLGKLPGSVWTIPTEPLRVPDHLGIDHFAAFPTEWPKRIIQGWSPAGVCVECGEGRRPVALVEKIHGTPRRVGVGAGRGSDRENENGYNAPGDTRASSVATITGYACSCPEPTADTRPAVVLDPFGGTGTTAMVAKVLGRHGITVDMSADYCRLAEWRTNDRNQLAKVLGVPKTDTPDPDQLGLFDGDDAA